ncbi:hypothetical protein DFH06DRAFT_1248067 [Mycena polygramma]|nr:hypothetical protein DFH06DRAFT_1248067 [Mycena polygramma]
MSWHARHVTLRHASEPCSECRAFETHVAANHSISPSSVKPRSPPPARDSAPKPRSRRCFVCGTTGSHPLDFRVCPRTHVLLRRSLARINDEGRLVAFDGSPLPMTRHPGGVAAHLISRFRNPTRIVLAPPAASPSPTFNSSSPHAIPPIARAAPEPEPEHVPLRQSVSPHTEPHARPNDALSRARASFLEVLLESLLNPVFRVQLRAIVRLIDRLHAEDPVTLRHRIQPVFERISHLNPP